MTVALGTSSGFVTVAPTADPTGTAATIDSLSIVTKDTSPSAGTLITEVGWWRDSGTDPANWEIGLYADNSGVADALLYVDATNSTTVTGWQVVSVRWPITANTAYWLAIQMDAHAGSSATDTQGSGGVGRDALSGQTTLNNPYGGGAVANPVGMAAIYALVVPSFVPAWGANATTTLGGVF
jgi:hypothetical protein